MAGYTQQLKGASGRVRGHPGLSAGGRLCRPPPGCCPAGPRQQQGLPAEPQRMVVNTSLISNLIFPIVMLVGLFLAFDGRLTMGTVSTAASMANFVITPCNQIAQCWAKVRSSKASVSGWKQPCPARKKVSAGRAIGKLEHIECKDTGFFLPRGRCTGAARRPADGLRAGKAVLVGESGCGKSTLAKLLFQYYPDYTGSILFNGQQLRDIDRQSLYQRVGYIAQTTYLFNDTLRSNICLARTSPSSAFPRHRDGGPHRLGEHPATASTPSSARTARISRAGSASASASHGWRFAGTTSSSPTRSPPASTPTPADRSWKICSLSPAWWWPSPTTSRGRS